MKHIAPKSDLGNRAEQSAAGASAVGEAFKSGWDRAAIACIFWMMGKGMSDEDIDSFVNALKLAEPKP